MDKAPTIIACNSKCCVRKYMSPAKCKANPTNDLIQRQVTKNIHRKLSNFLFEPDGLFNELIGIYLEIFNVNSMHKDP